MFTIRFVSSSGVSTWITPSSSSQERARAARPSSTVSGFSQCSIVRRTPFLSIVWEPGGSNLASGGFSA